MYSKLSLYLVLSLVSSQGFAAKLPKPTQCPSVVDLETNEVSRAANKYRCFSNDKNAQANGFLPLSRPSISEKLTNCSADKNNSENSLKQCNVDLQACRSTQVAPAVCPPPSTSPNGLVSIENIGALSGAEIWSFDGKTFLGVVSKNKFDANSIANEFGNFGSTFSQSSIFNEFGNFGSQFSHQSAFNNLTQSPPVLWRNGKAEAYVTTNKLLSPRVTSKLLKIWFKYDEY
jgi:hypothetical protein